MLATHPAFYDKFRKTRSNLSQIPHFSPQKHCLHYANNAILHYLNYDREGQLVKAIREWSDMETMMDDLSKVK